jgi:hypothetical protein
MTFVKWKTIVNWKRRALRATIGDRSEPYQYSSDNYRFLEIDPGDVLWIVTTPRFGASGKPSIRGRARPPAVMARLRVARLCCNRNADLQRLEQAGKKPLCLEAGIPVCQDEGVHPDSEHWSIMAMGEVDPEPAEPLETTYPVLYNFFGILDRLKFVTQAGTSDLGDYLEFVEKGEYLTTSQMKAKRAGTKVLDPGPYAAFGQHLQTLRELSPESASLMDRFHSRAVLGKRIFFSYSWADVEELASSKGLTRKEWARQVNRGLDELGFNPWLDDHQILAELGVEGLLGEVLSDAVRQSVVFVALLTKSYGAIGGWTLEEWRRAWRQLQDPDRRDRMVVIVLNCGGDPERLGLTCNDTIQIPKLPRALDIVRVIADGFESNRFAVGI